VTGTLLLKNTGFIELTDYENLLVDGGGWVRTTFGVVGGVVGGEVPL